MAESHGEAGSSASDAETDGRPDAFGSDRADRITEGLGLGVDKDRSMKSLTRPRSEMAQMLVAQSEIESFRVGNLLH